MSKDCTRSVTLQKDKEDQIKCCEPIEPLPCCVCDHRKPSAFAVFVCEHKQEIQYGLAGLGALALLLLVRSTRGGPRFTHIQDIPGDYFEKGVMLKGRVHSILPNGILNVEHTPNGRLPWAATPPDEELLPVNLCAVNMTPAGINWLEKRALNRNVWFRLICVTPEYVNCSVKVSRGFTKILANEALVKQGICRVEDLTKMPMVYPHLLVQMYKGEHYAERKGLGMWAEETRRWWNPMVILKKLFLWPITFCKRALKYKKYREKISL